MTDSHANIIWDIAHPQREMFVRNGEIPVLAVIAIHPMHSEMVAAARKAVCDALYILMGEPTNTLVVIEQEVIEMESGDAEILDSGSLLMSFLYERSDSKLIHLELKDQNRATLH